MQYSTNYNLNLVEGTDIVNPLVIDKPNYQTIDAAMKANKDAAIDSASHTKAGTVHAIVRSNTDANAFRFVASAPFVTGDTFTVDGNAVTGINTAGEGLTSNDFVIGASVLCVLNGATLTLNVNKNITIPSTYNASDIVYDNTGSGLVATDSQNAIDELQTEITGIIKSDTVSGTTNSKGELSSNIAISNRKILLCICTEQHYISLTHSLSDNYIFVAFDTTSGGNMAPAQNMPINITYYYI